MKSPRELVQTVDLKKKKMVQGMSMLRTQRDEEESGTETEKGQRSRSKTMRVRCPGSQVKKCQEKEVTGCAMMLTAPLV